MERLEIDISLPIVPNHGLGGMELGKNIGEYQLILNGKAAYLFSQFHSEDYRLDGFNAWYTFQEFSMQIGVDVRTGKIFQIRAMKGYLGSLFGKIHIGMKAQEAFELVPALYYDEMDEAIYYRSHDEGVALEFAPEETDPRLDQVPSLTIEGISVFAPALHPFSGW
jgi:hypothetical protein